jgi:hypothetical protein
MRQTSSQSTNPTPSRVLDRENYHYVKVQNADKGDWQTPIEDYIHGTEDIPPHEVVSTDRAVTGSSRMTLLRIPKDVHEARMKRIGDDSRRTVAQTENKGDEFGQVEGGVLSI